jgi:spore maturation protein CgeB
MGLPIERRLKFPLIRRGVFWVSDPALPTMQDRYSQRCHAPVFGLRNYEILGRSKIVFNSHINIAGSYAANIRLFEATGMGACLITDWKDNLRDLFEPDVEVMTYRTVAECAEKVNYLLKHPAELKGIASAGQRRTLREHTYYHRAQQLVNIVASVLKKGS